MAAAGAAPALAVPAAVAATPAAQPSTGSALGPVTLDAPDGYHGSVTVTVPGCDYRSQQQQAVTWVYVGGRTLNATSDARSPDAGRVTVPVSTLGNPGAEVSVGASCEVGVPECAPDATSCVGTALMAVPARRWKLPFPHYLAPGQMLDADHPTVSTGRDGSGARLSLTPSGDLVHHAADGRRLWSAGTRGSNVQLRAQDDGNLVLYADATTAPKPVWATWTQGNPGARVALHEDGRLAVYSAQGDRLWSPDSSAPPAPQPAERRNELTAPGSLTAGTSLRSPDGRVVLAMQGDGNLVAYAPGNRVLWHSRTHGNRGARLTLQDDGNLVVYSRTNRALWNSRTHGNRGARLTLQDDGNLVLYSRRSAPLWSTGTVLRAGGTVRAAS